jgi:hypothetical protein
MIKFRTPEERQILLHYADKFNNDRIEALLNEGLKSPSDAEELAHFFWEVVDQSATDHEKGITVLGFNSLESWCEDIMQSLRSHFSSTGYMKIWEDESDKS